MNHKESERWLHESEGWVKTGTRTGEQLHVKNKMQYWLEGRVMVFKHILTGKEYRGMEQEVCAKVDSFMHRGGYYKK